MNKVLIYTILDLLDSRGIKYDYEGDKYTEVNGFSSLANYREGTITWIKKQELIDSYKNADCITCAIAEKGLSTVSSNIIYVSNSKDVFFNVLQEFWGNRLIAGSIGEGTVIDKNVSIDPSVVIGCNCSIIGNVVIGANTVIDNNVVIQGDVRIGRNCHIQSLSVIGIDGFGYSIDRSGKKNMIEHFGGVEIGDNVFIGSHVNIARGTIDNTIIGSGTKIAPSTHIGHNNKIGKDVTIICSNLYGSVEIGDRSYVTASTIENQHSVGNNSVVGMGSVVMKSIDPSVIAYGIPAKIVRNNDSGL